MMSMTPRQRWQAVLSGRSPDRIPSDYWATDEVTARLLRELGCATERELYLRLGIDKCVRLAPVHRGTGENRWHIQSQYKAWHIGTKVIPYGEGLGSYEETIECPLAGVRSVGEIDKFDWPDPDDWDISGMGQQCREWVDFPIIAGCYEPFYLYCRLRGMEQALEDLVADSAIAEAILEHIHGIQEYLDLQEVHWLHCRTVPQHSGEHANRKHPGSLSSCPGSGLAGITDQLLVLPSRVLFIMTTLNGRLPLDMGEPLKNLPDQYIPIADDVNHGEITFYEAELVVFGFSHAHVGATLAERWGFPPRLVEAIGFHHDPEAASNQNHKQLAYITALANKITTFLGFGFEAAPTMVLHELPAAKLLGLDLSAIDAIVADTNAALQQMPETLKS